MKPLRNLALCAILWSPTVLNAATLTLDFEDGSLPSSSGWQRIASENLTAQHNIVSGSVPGVGGNNVLRSSGTNSFGWYFDLTGQISPDASWSFSGDARRVVAGSGGANDFGFTKFGSDQKQVHIGSITDNLWHRFVVSYDALTDSHQASVDGNSFIPADPASNQNIHYAPGVEDAVSFIFGNIGTSNELEFDNIAFSYQNPTAVPLPAGLFLLLGGLASFVAIRKKASLRA